MNTAQKRMSAMNLASPWRGPLVAAAESGTTQGNRQAALFMYSGILAGAVATVFPTLAFNVYVKTSLADEVAVKSAISSPAYVKTAQAGNVEVQ